MRHESVRRWTVCAAGTAVGIALTAAPALAEDAPVPPPATFTSTLTAMATPETVVDDGGKPSPGQPGAKGTFTLKLNSQMNIVCYEIMVMGVTPPFASPARTATHLQEGQPNQSGNPRMVFPDPQGPPGGPMTSKGCLQGPFTTGLVVNGADTGTGFDVKQLEANPAAWFVDTHTQQFRNGAVRGQLSKTG